MASKAQQDAKNEKILRALSKQPENKRCINCESLGPSYIVTDLKIFVCTTCSGVHRSFGHRVKSISMATFSNQEVKGMQEGGNLVAEATYLARWTPRDHPKPTDKSEEKISKWIRAVYADKSFYSSITDVSQQEEASHQNHESSTSAQAAPAAANAAPVPSLLDFDESPAPPAAAAPASSNGWAAFDNGFAAPGAEPQAAGGNGGGGGGGWDAFHSASPPAAAAQASSSSDGWASFGDAPPQPQGGTQAADAGWAAFGTSPGASEVKEVSKSNTRSELPSDLFSEPAQPTFPGSGGPASTMPGYGARAPAYNAQSLPGFGAAVPGAMAMPPYGAGAPGMPPAPAPAAYGGAAGIPQYGGGMGMPSGGGNPFGGPGVAGSLGMGVTSPPGMGVTSPPGMGVTSPPGVGGNPFDAPSQPARPQPAAPAAGYGGMLPYTAAAAGGNPFGGPSPVTSPPLVGGPVAPHVGAAPSMPASSGNPFSLVTHEAQAQAQQGPPDAFKDLMPALGGALPPGQPNSAAAPPMDGFGSLARRNSAGTNHAFGTPVPASNDPFASFA